MFVYLDPRAPDVRVPKWLAAQPQLVLQVGLDLPVPIPDLRVDDAGVYGTLSFNRAPFTCVVPWEAVFAIVGDDGMGMVWAESMPEEIAAEVEHAVERELSPAGKPTAARPDVALAPARPGPQLRAIEGGGESDGAEDDEPRGTDEPKRPHLRVIK